MSEEYTYAVVRADMSPGYKIVQTAHAVAEHYRSRPETPHGTMIVLETPDQGGLLALYQKAVLFAPTTLFYEPDVDEYTAFCVSPSSFYTFLSDLPLAGSQKRLDILDR